MCGICGFIGGGGEVLRQMRDALAHRGPDEAGEFIDDRVALGHRRLSIVDLKTGQQPLHAADDSVVVVFNGEIYNHPQLKNHLEQRGHVYRTNSDTESIVNAYLEYGLECPQHLDGMFAFVLYDRVRRRLFAARDRFGKKPLYYGLPLENGRRSFVFASEIRSLLRHPVIRRDARISEAGVYEYLLRDYLPGRQTILDNIWKLEAGRALAIDLRSDDFAEPKIWEYWRNPILDPPSIEMSEPEAADEVVRLLDQAIQRRLMADVPLGVFLSGGLDSSAITALLLRSMPPGDIRTFSIGFEEQSFDESSFAETVSRHLGTTHQRRMFSATDCLAELERVSAHMDEPFADPSMLPMSLLCRFARESVTVALGGDGGDELFAGYDPFRALAPARIYAAVVPVALDRFFQRLTRLMPASEGNMPWSFRAQRFLRGAKSAPALRLPTWLGAFSAQQLGTITSGHLVAPVFGPEVELFERVRRQGGDDVQAALAYFQRFYLTDDILVKADRASMMHSLEVRAPFLDTALAEFVNRLPSRFKFRGGAGKVLLKRAFSSAGRQGMLPPQIVGRAKKGFGIPVARWIRRELRAEFHEKLVDSWPSSLGMIDKGEIARLLAAHVGGSENNYKELWALYVLGEWARRWAL